MSDLTELGKRLVACKGFRWMPGMLCRRRLHTGEWVPVRLTDCTIVADYRVVERTAVPSMNQDAARMMGEGYIALDGWVLADDLLPDLSDAATRGCILQLIREAWGDNSAWLEATNRYYAFNENGPDCCEPAWILHVLDRSAQTYRKIAGATEEEAMSCALEMLEMAL